MATVLATLLLLASEPSFPTTPLKAAVEAARSQERVILTEFWSFDAEPSRSYASKVLSQPSVTAWLAEHAVGARVNADFNRKLRADLAVKELPTLLVLDADLRLWAHHGRARTRCDRQGTRRRAIRSPRVRRGAGDTRQDYRRCGCARQARARRTSGRRRQRKRKRRSSRCARPTPRERRLAPKRWPSRSQTRSSSPVADMNGAHPRLQARGGLGAGRHKGDSRAGALSAREPQAASGRVRAAAAKLLELLIGRVASVPRSFESALCPRLDVRARSQGDGKGEGAAQRGTEQVRGSVLDSGGEVARGDRVGWTIGEQGSPIALVLLPTVTGPPTLAFFFEKILRPSMVTQPHTPT